MRDENIFNFEKLKIYQKSLEYIDFVYKITDNFPRYEMFNLTIQFRRAANSIALNIAEGESGTKKEFLNFLRISNRSIRECVVCTSLSFRRNYITENEHSESRSKLAELSKMNSGLTQSLNK